MSDNDIANGKERLGEHEAPPDIPNGGSVKDERTEDIDRPDDLLPDTPPEDPSCGDALVAQFTADDLADAFREEYGDLVERAEEISLPVRGLPALDMRIERAKAMRYAIVGQAVCYLRDAGVALLESSVHLDVADLLPDALSAQIVIHNDDAAALVVAALQAYEQKIAQIKEQAAQFTADAGKRRDFIRKVFGQALEDHLKNYIDGQETKKPTRSIKLMTGMSPVPPVLKMTRTNARVVVDDESKFMAWQEEEEDRMRCDNLSESILEDFMQMVKIVPAQYKPVAKEINKYWKSTGEVPPGCDVIPAGDSFSIKL